MSKNQFTGTGLQPQCHRIFCQFYNDQYCTLAETLLGCCLHFCTFTCIPFVGVILQVKMFYRGQAKELCCTFKCMTSYELTQ